MHPPHDPLRRTTLGGVLRQLFPEPSGSTGERLPGDPGTDGANADAESEWAPYVEFPHRGAGAPIAYAMPPLFPPDMFAAAAYLMEASGAYHHINTASAARRPRSTRQIAVDERQRSVARAIGLAWRSFRPDKHFDPTNPSVYENWLAKNPQVRRLYRWWDFVFVRHASTPVFESRRSTERVPSWWRAAHWLLMAADEASEELGWTAILLDEHGGTGGRNEGWITTEFAGMIGRGQRISSLSSASRDVVSVLPKARTAAVGCTPRSLSHHLALLPPQGVARGWWTPYIHAGREGHSKLEQHMNMLLVPFPYSIPSNAFRAHADYTREGARFGYFEIAQSWLDEIEPVSLARYVIDLVQAAQKECDEIHVIVFPELSLDRQRYDALAQWLPTRFPDLELLVAGVSDKDSRAGNFVAVTSFQTNGRGQRSITTQREKHHRWRIDENQIRDYGLEGRLNPAYIWWEDIDLLSRRLDFNVVRPGTAVCAMICEDLARVDPCQELLRAVGPNIVFALLMDAPQLKARWPARYATVLAEDPGSAVLTLTSRALMTRQHRLGIRPSASEADRIVGLWRDDVSAPVEIICPVDAQAVRLTLFAQRVPDVTLDGREDKRAVAWRYASQRPIRLEHVVQSYPEILGADDMALQREGTP